VRILDPLPKSSHRCYERLDNIWRGPLFFSPQCVTMGLEPPATKKKRKPKPQTPSPAAAAASRPLDAWDPEGVHASAVRRLLHDEEADLIKRTQLVTHLDVMPFFVVTGDLSAHDGFYLPTEYVHEKGRGRPRFYKCKKWKPTDTPDENYGGPDYLLTADHPNVLWLSLFPYYIVPTDVDVQAEASGVDRAAFVREKVGGRHVWHDEVALEQADLVLLTSRPSFMGLRWEQVMQLERGVLEESDISSRQVSDMGTILKVLMADEKTGFVQEYMTTSFDDEGVL